MSVRGVALCALLVACDAPAPAPPQAHERPQESGAIVANVDGAPVYASEVLRVAAREHVSGARALDMIIDERLLAAHATQTLPSVEQERAQIDRRALVQVLLLREVEDAVTEETLSESALRAAYDAHRAEFVHVEKRASLHVLARLPVDAPEQVVRSAETFASNVLDQMRREGVDPVFARYQAEPPEGLGFAVIVERVPAMTRDAAAAEPYKAALYAMGEPGPAARPVRTEFGVHAIALTDVTPARHLDFEQARSELVPIVLVNERHARYEAFVASLQQRTPPHIDPAGLQKALALTLPE